MSALYSDGESQDYETLSILFENIKDEEIDQFIQDLRNALSVVLYSDHTGNYAIKIEEVKKNRDLEYYRTNQKL